MVKRDEHELKQDFRKRQTRQIIAVAAGLFLVLLGAVIYKRPDIFGEISGRTVFGIQAIVIAAFIGFTAMNWRCPACRKHLGGDIYRKKCNKCGTRLH